MSALLTRALRLAERGVPVFPVLPTKAPACPHGFKDASADPDEVRRLFLAAPRADRIGMPTGAATGTAVLDVDPVGMTWLGLNRRRMLEPTRVHATPRGGRHLFFMHPDGLRCSSGKLAPGVDIRAEGGSITIWGPGYAVLDASPRSEFPKFVLLRLRAIERLAEKRRRELEAQFRASGDINQEHLVRFIRQRRNGERNAALFWASCRVGEAGGSGEALIAAGLEVGLSLPEARSTVRSGLQRGRMSGGARRQTISDALRSIAARVAT